MPNQSQAIEVDSYDLKMALQRLRPAVVSAGSVLPILSSVRLVPLGRKRLRLTGTDLELTIETEIPTTARKGPGFVFPFGLLADVVSGAARVSKRNPDPVPVTLTADGERVSVQYGPRRLSLVPLPLDEYPRLPVPRWQGSTVVPAEPFGEVAKFTSSDCARPILTGVFLTGGHLVATDSYRIGVRTDMPETADLIIPARAAQVIARIGGEPLMEWSEREVRFTWQDDQIEVTARLIEGEFPNYKGLLPTEDPPNQLTLLDPPLMLSALAAMPRIRRENEGVRFDLNGSGFTVVKMDDGDIADEFTIPTRYVGEPMTVGFNPRYLRSVLNGVDKPSLALGDPRRPAVASDDKRIRLIMPVWES